MYIYWYIMSVTALRIKIPFVKNTHIQTCMSASVKEAKLPEAFAFAQIMTLEQGEGGWRY